MQSRQEELKLTEKVLVFAGTTEGRQLCEYLAGYGLDVTACVATEYGRVAMPERENLRIHTGRLDAGEMSAFIAGFSLVIDATHPYAEVVTRNIQKACRLTGAEYLRLLRPSQNVRDAVVLPDAKSAAAYLAKAEGNVLLTTGSKELSVFAGMTDFPSRCYARVLPSVESIGACRAVGLSGRHIVAMQGPFSHGMNLALLRETGAHYLVTKNSGPAGGFDEKLSAAKEANAAVVLINRPAEETGLDFQQMTEWLDRRFGIKKKGESHFPLFLDLEKKRAVLVGGGKIAARRAAVLLSFGAQVTVIAPELGCEMRRQENCIEWKKKVYEPGDLSGAALTVCASSSRDANRAAAEEAKALGIPVSVADRKEESTFYFPAIVEGGGVVGGFISAQGSSHSVVREMAEKLRRFLNG